VSEYSTFGAETGTKMT